MGSKSVAVLDVRSSEITVVVGERGVNNTFVFKAMHTESYYGYENGEFYDTAKLSDAVGRCVDAVEKTTGERLREIFVGVPGEFISVAPSRETISFPKRRKITERDVALLREKGKAEREGYQFVRTSSMIYTTSDKRRTVNPVGLLSTSLQAVLAYYYCTDYFAETMEKIFGELKISVRYLPTVLAMATYLIPAQTRDEYAFFLDSGFLSSTLSIVQGGGEFAEVTFPVGRIQAIYRIMKEFSLPLEAAKALLARANLYSKNVGKSEFVFRGAVYEVDMDRLVELVKDGLDELCEQISKFLENSGKEFENQPIYVSGEGIADIRGALEHVSKRVSRICEPLAPNLPFYNKPSMSSYIALVDMAYGEPNGGGFFTKLFHGFGG